MANKRARRRAALLASVTLAILLVLGALDFLGKQTTSPAEQAAMAKAPAPSSITVAVRTAKLTENGRLRCSLMPRVRRSIPIRAVAEAGDPIVTGLPIRPGNAVTEGSVTMEVSGRPVIAITGDLPPYRELGPDSRGPDVIQLQRALKRLGLLSRESREGVFGDSTAAAVEALYRETGYRPLYRAQTVEPTEAVQPSGEVSPDQTSTPLPRPVTVRLIRVPKEELAALPELPAVIGPSAIARGSSPSEGAQVVDSVSRAATCDAARDSVNSVLKSKSLHLLFDSGQRVTVSVSAGTSKPSSTDGGNLPAEADASGESTDVKVIATPVGQGGIPASARTGSSLILEYVVAAAPAAGTVVPASAMWTRADGTVVVTTVSGGHRSEIPVRVGFRSAGSAIVAPADGFNLKAGDQVEVRRVGS